MARSVAVLFVLAAAFAAEPDRPPVISGRVFDARTLQPIAGAEVEIVGRGVFLTDEQGGFEAAAGPGPLTVRINRVGFHPRTWTGIVPGPERAFPLLPELIRVEEVTVTASRMPLPVRVSGPVSRVRFDRDRVPGMTDATELLRRAVGVLGRDYGNYGSLALRGTGLEHTLLMLDGIRLNSSQSGTYDLSLLPVGLFSGAEIVRGGGSALYGSSPVGGTVNLITPEPERLGLRLRTGLGGFGRRYLEAVHQNRRAELGYLVGFAADAADNNYEWTDTEGQVSRMANTDLERTSVFAKGSWSGREHRFGLFGTWAGTNRGVPGPRTWPSDSARRDDRQGLAGFGHTYEPDERLRLETRVSAGRHWQNYRDPAAFIPVSDTHAVATAGGRVDAAWTPVGGLTLLAGAELDRDRLSGSALGEAERVDAAGVGQVRLEWQGLAVQPALRFEELRREHLPGGVEPQRHRADGVLTTDEHGYGRDMVRTGRGQRTEPQRHEEGPLQNTEYKMGGRKERPQTLSEAGHRTTLRVATPRVTLSWSGSFPVVPYFSFGRSFRAPTFNELYWPADEWTRGNPALEPEWATGLELGLGFEPQRHRADGVLTTDKHGYGRDMVRTGPGQENNHGDTKPDRRGATRHRPGVTHRAYLGFYRNSLTDLIQWQPDDSFRWRPVNVATATITGLEAEAGLEFGPVGLEGSFNWCRASSERERLLYRPELFGRALARARGRRGRFDLQASLAGDWAGNQLTDPAYPDTLPERMPGYVLFDFGLGLGYAPGPARMNRQDRQADRGFMLTAGVRNLTDRRVETVRHYPRPGRNWYVELELGI